MTRSSQQGWHIALSDPYCLAQVPWYLVGIYCLAFKVSIFWGDGSQIPSWAESVNSQVPISRVGIWQIGLITLLRSSSRKYLGIHVLGLGF